MIIEFDIHGMDDGGTMITAESIDRELTVVFHPDNSSLFFVADGVSSTTGEVTHREGVCNLLRWLAGEGAVPVSSGLELSQPKEASD